MQSKITGGDTTLLFTAKILNKHHVKFYRCNDTGFIQTEEPYWLEEAYLSAITKLDVGLVMRNINLASRVSLLLRKEFNYKGAFLDYAGGYGLFTRLMRDKGFNFYHTDLYCQNIFAAYFDLNDVPKDTKFELVTAFEVFEHLTDPISEIKKMLQYSDNLLFSTELQPEGIKTVDDWIYFSKETGQHIAFYNEASLQAIAAQLGYNFYTDGSFLHVFTKQSFDHSLFDVPKDNYLVRKLKKYINKATGKPKMPQSLLDHDWRHIKSKLQD
jgi:hypothetical protein